MNQYRKENIYPPYFFAFSTILLAIISYIFYWPSLNYGFKFDDGPNIMKFYGIRHKTLSDLFFSSPRWISSWLNTIYYSINKFDPFIYRFANITFHSISGLLLFFIIYKCLNNIKISELKIGELKTNKLTQKGFLKKYSFFIAFTTAALFLLHPVQTQTVSYVIQAQLEGMATFFTLSIIACFISASLASRNVIKYAGYTITLFLSFLSTGTKEIAIVAPLLVLAVDWFFISQGDSNKLKSRWIFYGILFSMIALCYAYLLKPDFFANLFKLRRYVDHKTGNLLTKNPHDKITVYSYFISQFKVILHYIGIFIYPFNISVDYDWKICSSFFSYDCLLPFTALISLSSYSAYRLYKNKTDIISFCFIWFIIVVTPRSSIVPDTELLADYKTYLASIGIVLLLAIAFIKTVTCIAEQFSKHYDTLKIYEKNSYTFIYSSIIALILLPMGYLTYSRNCVWENEESFWLNIIKRAPQKARAHNNYGIVLFDQKRYSKALEHLKKAVELDSSYSDPWINISCVYNKLNDLDKALQAALKSIEVNPILQAYHNLGCIYLRRAEYKDAKKHFKHVVKNQPTHGQAYFDLGCTYNELSKKEKSWSCFKKCCTQADFDTHEISFNMYGLTSLLLEKYTDAIYAYEKSLEINPQSTKSKFNLAQAYSSNNNPQKASFIYEDLIKQLPTDTFLLYKYAQELFKLNIIEKALEYYQKVKKLDPDNTFIDSQINSCKKLLKL